MFKDMTKKEIDKLVEELNNYFSPNVADHKERLKMIIEYIKAMELLNDPDIVPFNDDDIHTNLILCNDNNIRGLLTEMAFVEQNNRNIKDDMIFRCTTSETVSMVIDVLLDMADINSFTYNCENFEQAIEEGIALSYYEFNEKAEKFVDENIDDIKKIAEFGTDILLQTTCEILANKYEDYLNYDSEVNIQYPTTTIVCLTKIHPFCNALLDYINKNDLPINYFNNVIKGFQYFTKKKTVDNDIFN